MICIGIISSQIDDAIRTNIKRVLCGLCGQTCWLSLMKRIFIICTLGEIGEKPR